jgi:hypothetical protein
MKTKTITGEHVIHCARSTMSWSWYDVVDDDLTHF